MKRLILTAAALLFAGHASATTVNFTGTVTTGFGGVSAGAALTGTYDFDPTTTPRAGSNSTFAVFDAVTALSFTVAGYGTGTFANAGGGPEIQVDNNPPAPDTDRYGVTSRVSDGLSGPNLGANVLNGFSFRMDDSTNSIFSDALVLPGAPNLGDFDSSLFFVFFNDANGRFAGTVVGELNSLAVIPLPAALPLVLSGLASLGLIGWRRRASAA